MKFQGTLGFWKVFDTLERSCKIYEVWKMHGILKKWTNSVCVFRIYVIFITLQVSGNPFFEITEFFLKPLNIFNKIFIKMFGNSWEAFKTSQGLEESPQSLKNQ